MKNSMVAHNWANQVKPRGCGSNFYYDGPVIYSWGPHFIVGRLVDTKKAGGRVALLNSRTYSVSTSRHQGEASRALSHIERFYVPNPDVSAEAVGGNLAYFAHEIEERKGRLLAGRVRLVDKENWTTRIIEEAARYLELFKPKNEEGKKAAKAIRKYTAALTAGALLTPEERAIVDRRKAAAAEREAREEAEREARNAVEREKYRGRLELWKANRPDENGAEVRANGYAFSLLPTALRLNKTGAAVETSRGAVVSTRAARVLWAAIKAGRPIVGAVIDGFTVRSEEGGRLVIGCHTIEADEVKRMGEILDGMEKSEKGGAE